MFKKTAFLFFLAMLPAVSLGAANKVVVGSQSFYPHLAQPAFTLRQGRVGIYPYAGADTVNHSVALNSVNYGLTSGWEVGTVPLMYFATAGGGRTSVYNLTTKINFFDGETFDMGFGLTAVWIEIMDHPKFQRARAQDYMPILAWNYYFNQDWTMGFNVGSSLAVVDVQTSNGSGAMQSTQSPYYIFDLCRRLTSSHFLTWGLSFQTYNYTPFLRALVDSGSPSLGSGLSYTFKRQRGWFSAVSAGAHYIPAISAWRSLFSIAF